LTTLASRATAPSASSSTELVLFLFRLLFRLLTGVLGLVGVLTGLVVYVLCLVGVLTGLVVYVLCLVGVLTGLVVFVLCLVLGLVGVFALQDLSRHEEQRLRPVADVVAERPHPVAGDSDGSCPPCLQNL